MMIRSYKNLREKRHRRVRAKVKGIPERPRLSVFRSNKSIYAQVIDDTCGHTLCAASEAELQGKPAGEAGGKVGGAFGVGELLAKRALPVGIKRVVFDRGGYRYHGRVRALADGARKGGLVF
ncbi:50S ribosomal protein L18 [Candidatus Parcubacteria bacterium]|nr:50S ribosomal protein L18 [Candidatus Parcubacteria bacterium]